MSESAASSARGRVPGIVVFVVLLALYLLHNDFWLWKSPRLIAGLPVSLVYHGAYCLAVIVVMAVLVRFAWPRDLTGED